MLAALYGVRSFARDVSNSHILLLTDNITVVAYVNHLGAWGATSRGYAPTLSRGSGRQRNNNYSPGLENIRADFMSRHLLDRKFNPQIFDLLDQQWGPFTLDLFVTRLMRQCLNWKCPDSRLERRAHICTLRTVKARLRANILQLKYTVISHTVEVREKL